jgi:hypothetical protein
VPKSNLLILYGFIISYCTGTAGRVLSKFPVFFQFTHPLVMSAIKGPVGSCLRSLGELEFCCLTQLRSQPRGPLVQSAPRSTFGSRGWFADVRLQRSGRRPLRPIAGKSVRWCARPAAAVHSFLHGTTVAFHSAPVIPT